MIDPAVVTGWILLGIFGLVVLGIAFMALRFFWLWYFRVDDIVLLLESIAGKTVKEIKEEQPTAPVENPSSK